MDLIDSRQANEDAEWNRLKRKGRLLTEEIRQAESAKDWAQVDELLARMNEINRSMGKIYVG